MLYLYINKFIIVVSNITHFGKLKKITFKSFAKNMSYFIVKIDIVYYDNVYNRKEHP